MQSDDPEHQRRVEELNKRLLAQKLEWQAKQSEEDAKWLQAEELNMVCMDYMFTCISYQPCPLQGMLIYCDICSQQLCRPPGYEVIVDVNLWSKIIAVVLLQSMAYF